jgi:hypothetical protein
MRRCGALIVECREGMAADAYYSYVLRDLEAVP